MCLRLATDVHWSGVKQNRAERKRLRVVLSVLPTIPHIRLLSLHNADIDEVQQRTIFGIPSLRTLVVNSCQFVVRVKALPPSHINALKLAYNGVRTVRHLLTTLAPTLETIKVDEYDVAVRYILQNESVVLPRLSTFIMENTHNWGHCLAVLGTPKRYRSITTLCIRFCSCLSELRFAKPDLPALRILTSDYKLASRLIPGRPVTTYVEARCTQRAFTRGVLLALSESRGRITSLKLFVHHDLYSVLPSLASSCQHLEQLTLRTSHLPSAWLWACARDHLLGRPFRGLPLTAGAVFPKLKRVTILVNYSKYRDLPPVFIYEWMLRGIVVLVCPALAWFECLDVYHTTPFDLDRPTEPNRAWKVWRRSDGSWERQGPPPTPTHKSVLCAAP